MTIEQLLSKLIESTNNDSIEWFPTSTVEYRYISDKGGISLKKMPNQYYVIKLYDMDNCFASYNTQEITGLDVSATELFTSIVSSINRAIEKKIGDVFGGM